MNKQQINPEKITKPIQLLAAWLLGLILMNSAFLTAAAQINKPDWAAGLLVIATVLNVPLFLVSLFLLQTKFRPEMQEDTYYSKYLERKYDDKKTLNPKSDLDFEKERKATAELITKEILNSEPNEKKEEKIQSILKSRDIQRIEKIVGTSRALSQLFLYPDKWKEFVIRWKENESFKSDLEELLFFKAVIGDISKPEKIKLTPIGKEIAEKTSENKKLWNQRHNTILD